MPPSDVNESEKKTVNSMGASLFVSCTQLQNLQQAFIK